MLAIVFSAHKFREYILGKATMVQTDHLPLKTIRRKTMSVAPLHLQAMILKVSEFDVKVEYLPGKKTDPSWHSQQSKPGRSASQEDELQVNMIERISISEAKYAELQQNTANELHVL